MIYPSTIRYVGHNGGIDLRSDTVTKPDDAMREIMANAPVGDDVWGDDPSILELQDYAAEQLGKAAALWFPSGTQSNLAAMLAHCPRGADVITGHDYHAFCAEARGASILGGISFSPVTSGENGAITPAQIAANIYADDFHFPMSALISLENTVHGQVQDQANLLDICQLAKLHNLKLHLDGARLCNASVASKTSLAQLAAPFDTVSLCLSKGLGAPAGTILAGDAATIAIANRNRKLLGGGMRQVGILAAAGLYAMKNNFDRLQDDHDNAKMLAQALQSYKDQLTISHATNMVFVTPLPEDVEKLTTHLGASGITIAPGASIRMVCHKDISRTMIEQVITAFATIYRKQ